LARQPGVLAAASLPALHLEVLTVPVGHEQEMAERLQRDSRVLYAEPDYIYQALSTRPNDPFYTQYQWQLPHIGLETAWDTTQGKDSVIVAIVDSGVDLSHPDLASHVIQGRNVIAGNNTPEDDQGHGTHVAGIVGAMTNNHLGIAGIAWHVKLMPVKVLDSSGSGTSTQVATGVRWAVDHGARVINLSLGGKSSSATLRDAIDYAYAHDVLVVAAAGNAYQDGNPPIYPAAYPHVLAVAATDDQDRHASYSSSGPFVDVAAPGGDPSSNADQNDRHWILSTYWRGSNYAYAFLAGTSQAAPHVSGLAALLLSLNPRLSVDDLTQIITGTAVDVESPGRDDLTGYGRINVAAAVAAVLSTPTPTKTATASPTPTLTPTPTATETPSPTPTLTPTPTASATPTWTSTPTFTASPTPTLTPSPTVGSTVTPTATPTPTPSSTPALYPLHDTRVNNDSGNAAQRHPHVLVDETGAVWVVWRDNRSTPAGIYVGVLHPHQAGWTSNERVSPVYDSDLMAVRPVLTRQERETAIVWQDTRGQDENVYVSLSLANPSVWTALQQVNDDSTPPAQQFSPDAVMDAAGRLYVVWTDTRHGNRDLYWRTRTSGQGAHWQPAAPVPPASGPGVQMQPALAVDAAGKVYLAWANETPGRIEVAVFDPNTRVWQTLPGVGGGFTPGAQPILPDIVVEKGRIHVIWQEVRRPEQGFDIYHSVFENGAWTPAQRVNTDIGGAIQSAPRIARAPDGVVAVWEDWRLGRPDIYMSWWTPEKGWLPERRVADESVFALRSEPDVATDAQGGTHIVWVDARSLASGPDIYYRYIPLSYRYATYVPVMWVQR